MQAPQLMSRQFAGELATRWWRRDSGYLDNDCTLAELTTFDNTIDAMLDGLATHGEHGKQAAWAQLERAGNAPDAVADVFCVIAQLLVLQDRDACASAIDKIKVSRLPELVQALGAAFQWVDNDLSREIARSCIGQQYPAWIAAGLLGMEAHGGAQAEELLPLVNHAQDRISIRALNFMANAGMAHLIRNWDPLVSAQASPKKRYAAHRAMLFATGDSSLFEHLWREVQNHSQLLHDGLPLLGAGMPQAKQAKLLDALQGLNNKPELAVLSMCRRLGNTAHLNRCTRLLDSPYNAQSRQAIASITGCTLDGELPRPEQHAQWQRWWRDNSERFDPQQRYLMGQPVDDALLYHALVALPQSEREAAALHLSLRNPRLPLFAARLPARVQWRSLQQLALRLQLRQGRP